MNLAAFGREASSAGDLAIEYPPGIRCACRRPGPRPVLGAAHDIDGVLAAHRPDSVEGASTVTLSGQVETMRESYTGLFTGIALAIILVYLFLVMNFQSWIDPLIVLMAVPFALGGVLWMLFLSQTPMSVPALMGTLMCIGLTTANSILVVSFANQRMAVGDDPLRAAASAGYTRLRPGAHDRRRDDPRHGAHGPGDRRRRRAECAAGPRGHRRPVIRHLRDADFCSHDVPAAAPSPGACRRFECYR